MNAGVIYKSQGGVLQTCLLGHPTGNAAVNEAICGLVERCIMDEPKADAARLAACIKPRIARLASLIDGGLLAVTGGSEQDETPDDIIVAAKSLMPPPRPGRWMFVEKGTRVQVAGGDPGNMFDTKTLPTRHWQQCVKDEAVSDTLAMMLRENINERQGSPCPWSIDITKHQFNATRRCTIPGALMRGTLVGTHDDKTFTAYKSTLIRGLGRDPTLSRFTDASSPTSIEQSPSNPDPIKNRGAGQFDARGVEYEESTEVEGHLTGNC